MVCASLHLSARVDKSSIYYCVLYSLINLVADIYSKQLERSYKRSSDIYVDGRDFSKSQNLTQHTKYRW